MSRSAEVFQRWMGVGWWRMVVFVKPSNEPSIRFSALFHTKCIIRNI